MNDDTMFCTECGSTLDKSSVFCPVCGTKISGENQSSITNAPPPNQSDQSYNMNYANSSYDNNQPVNTSTYQPYYNQYGPPQYIPQKKKKNTLLIVILIVLGVLILAAAGYFGIKLLQGDTGTSTLPSDTNTNGTDTKQDISGEWEGTTVFTDAKNLGKLPENQSIIDSLNKPLKTKVEIDTDSKSSGEITIYIAEGVGEDPSDYGLPLIYEYRNGELKASLDESGNSVTVDLKLTSKMGRLQFKGSISVSGVQSNGSTATVKGTLDITRTSK